MARDWASFWDSSICSRGSRGVPQGILTGWVRAGEDAAGADVATDGTGEEAAGADVAVDGTGEEAAVTDGAAVQVHANVAPMRAKVTNASLLDIRHSLDLKAG